MVVPCFFFIYNRPFNELKTHEIAKKPTPTATNPQPATSSYLKAPKPINKKPMSNMIKVAQPNIVFLFIPIVWCFKKNKYR